jgi:hypothetical protein
MIINEHLESETEEQARIYNRAIKDQRIANAILPTELLELDTYYIAVYSSWISLGYNPPTGLNDIEQYNWAKQMQLLLDRILTGIEWDRNARIGESYGGMWFSGKVMIHDWEIAITVNTAKPPSCKIIKTEKKVIRETTEVKYEAICPPDLMEV